MQILRGDRSSSVLPVPEVPPSRAFPTAHLVKLSQVPPGTGKAATASSGMSGWAIGPGDRQPSQGLKFHPSKQACCRLPLLRGLADATPGLFPSIWEEVGKAEHISPSMSVNILE